MHGNMSGDTFAARVKGEMVGEGCEECKKKDAEIASLRKQLAEGIHLKGWWCTVQREGREP
jgi:hypothetical protein